MQEDSKKIWLITGTSSGFGKVWTKAALKRGDRVIATSRNIKSLAALQEEFGDRLIPLQLDVNDRQQCFDGVKKAVEICGRIDILVNNAGYGHFGHIEELSEDDVRKQFEANVFGSLWMMQALIPVMRQQKSGHIFQVSSVGGLMGISNLGAYAASKWAVEALADSLSQEVSPFGIKVTILEPNAYATEWGGSSAKYSDPLPSYDEHRNAVKKQMEGMNLVYGDPMKTFDALIAAIESPEPPLRLLIGKGTVSTFENIYTQRLAAWKQWESTSENC